MKTHYFRDGLFAAVFAFAVSPAFTALSADDAANAGKPASQLSMAEEKFVLKAAQDGMTEVKLGELAAQKGLRADVKEFGRGMTTDHGKANDELKNLAMKKSVKLPDQLDQTHAGMIDRLATLEGAQFDKAYIEAMVKDHEAAVSEFQSAAQMAKDGELKTFVSKTLPVLKAHLAHIQKIEAGKGQ